MSGTPHPPPPSPAWPRRALFALAGAFLLLFHAIVVRVRDSGAIPVEEFGPAKAIYAILPALLALGAAGAATGLLVRSKRGLPLSAGSALLLAGVFLPVLLPAGLLAVVAGAIALQASERRGDPAPAAALATAAARTSPAGLLRTFLLGAALGTATTAALAIAEAGLRTSGFAPRVFPAELLPPLKLALLAWAGAAGILFGAVAAGAALLFAGILAGTRRLRPDDPALVPFAGSLAVAAIGGIVLWRLVRGAFGDEIDTLGLSGAIGGLLVLVTAAIHAHVWSRLARTGFTGPGDARAGSAGAFAADLTSLAVLPPGRLPTSRPLRAALAGIVAAVVLGALAVALFPGVEDYREQGFSLYAALAFLVALTGTLAIVRTLGPRWRPGPIALALAGLLPIGAIAAGAGAATRADVRLVFHEYTRLGPLAADYLPEALFRPFPRIGEAQGAEDFPFHRPGEEVLPPRPEALADLPARPPILFVVWDAVRPDHLAAFGGERENTPAFDRLAAGSVLFTNARATATATTSSVRAFLSGRYATRWMLAPDTPPFFLRELAEAGYDRFLVTAMGTDYNGVSPTSFRRGWDPEARGVDLRMIDIPSDDDEGSDPPKVTEMLELVGDRVGEDPAALDGTFLYLHLIGGHLPWESTEYGPAPADRYDGEIAKLDRHLSRLLGGLRDLGVLDRMVIVVLADHGTGLGEHGRIGGFLTYEEQIRVPILVRVPGLEPRRVDDSVSLLDVAPTLVGLASPGRENPYHGRSLMPLMTGRADRLPPRPVVSLCAFADAYSILDGDARFKLWHHRGKGYEALYDLEADPGERRDVAEEHPEEAAELRALLDEFLRTGRGSFANPYHYRAP